MESKLNLVELLKGKEGLDLWSPLFGTAKLHKVHLNNEPLPIVVKTSNEALYSFSSKGTVNDCIDNITLFPSKHAYTTGRGWFDFSKSKKLAIINADEYIPMKHWIRGIDDIDIKRRILLRCLLGDDYVFDNSMWVYYKSPDTNQSRRTKIGSMSNGIMTEFVPVFAEVEEKPELTDKCVAWVWSNDDLAIRRLAFYDAKNKSSFSYDGKRSGYRYDNYEVCTNPELLAMMEPLRANLGD